MSFIELLSFLSRLLIGFVMLIAGSLKIRAGFPWFKQTLSSYIRLPSLMLDGVAHLLPWLEVGLGAMLIVGFLTLPMITVAFVLLLVFSLATLDAILNGQSHDCGCFGKVRPMQEGGQTIIYRNTVLMGVLLLLLFTKPFFAVDNLIHMRPTAMLQSIQTTSLVIYMIWVPYILWFRRFRPTNK